MTDRRVVPFKRWHLAWLEERGQAEGGSNPMVTPDLLRYIEGTNAWTAVLDGDPVCCGGTIEQWPGRSIGWAYLNEGSGREMVWLTRRTKAVLDRVKGRIEMTVRRDFAAGHRWARMLGFEIENPPGILRAYGPAQEDHIAYVRVN